MAEELDLNKIRRQVKEKVEIKPEETKGQKIESLKAQITEFEEKEEKEKGPSGLDMFLAKSREDQEAEVASFNQHQSEGHQFSLQEFID
jgi:hypothetical protein